jgi:hypothetical protein
MVVLSASLLPEVQTHLPVDLPDPADENLPEYEFQQRVDQAWLVCDRFDLQTEIWRGRILRAVRDREKRGGEGRGSGFLNWLKEREMTKSRAYSLIELANSADDLLVDGVLDPDLVNQFSKQSFLETAQAVPAVQQLIADSAREGKRITRQQVRQLTDEWTAVTSDLLPPVIREKAADNQLPIRAIAPLVRELEKLPEVHQSALQAAIEEQADLSSIKEVTTTARYLSRYLEAAAQVRTVDPEQINLEQALEEALRLDCLNLTADLVNQATQVEQAMTKLYTSWKRLSGLSERLWIESGSSTPHLRALLDQLQTLSGEQLSLPLGDLQTGRVIRLQILPDEV